MTVASVTSKVQYACNGVSQAFAVPFRILEPADLRVTLTNADGVDTLLTLNTHYAVTAATGGYQNGATVTTDGVYPANSKLTILRNIALTQSAVLPSNGPFPSESVENALDKLMMISQQQSESINRAILLPETIEDDATPGVLLDALSDAVTGAQLAAADANQSVIDAAAVVEGIVANSDIAAAAATSALSSQQAAELAMDATISASNLYADTTEGLAATTDGEYFSVPSTVSGEFLILYKNNAGSAQQIKVYPIDVALSSSFTLIPSKNLYNPALAENGYIYAYLNGNKSAFPTSAITGRMPVVAGKRYTLTMLTGTNNALFSGLCCWSSNGTYLGMNSLYGTNPVIPNMDVVTSNLAGSGCQRMSFSIPAGSGIAFVGTLLYYAYATHTTEDFDLRRNAIQLEEGSEPTAFKAYSAFPEAIYNKPIDPLKLPYLVPGSALIVFKKGGDLYIRSCWNESYYLLQKMLIDGDIEFDNNVVNFIGARKISSTSLNDIDFTFDNGSILTASADEAAPVLYDGIYTGGRHGVVIVEVTATNHGKEVKDVGSEWIDASSYKWYIMRIVNANKLWVMSKNLSVYPVWSFRETVIGNLTHSANATNTAGITVASQQKTQLTPGIQNNVKHIKLDGEYSISADGAYLCKSVDIVESYDIPNPAAVLNYVISCVGGSVQPDFGSSLVTDKDVHFDIIYRFALNGSCTVYHNIYAYRNLTLNYAGFIQSGVLTFTGKTLLQYVPGVNSFVGSLQTWDLAATEDISGTIEQLTLSADRWADPNNPPARMAQIVANGGTNEFGFILGYSPLRGIGMAENRKNLASGGFIFTTKKQYPYGVDSSSFSGGILPASTLLECVAYRSFYPCTGNATVLTWYKDGTDYVVILDYHQNVTQLAVELPAFMIGMSLSVIEQNLNFTLHTGSFVSASGIRISVTGNYGYALLKISNS